MNKLEFALEDFKNIQDLIKFIDQKARHITNGFIITASEEILGQVYEVSIILKNKRESFCVTVRILYSSVFLLLLFILSVKFL